MTTATAMTAKELAAQIRFRGCVATLVRLSAKNKVKELLRAQGKKVHHYSARELAEMAEEYLAVAEHREEPVAKASELAKVILARRR